MMEVKYGTLHCRVSIAKTEENINPAKSDALGKGQGINWIASSV
jgi:hypothetical protein